MTKSVVIALTFLLILASSSFAFNPYGTNTDPYHLNQPQQPTYNSYPSQYELQRQEIQRQGDRAIDNYNQHLRHSETMQQMQLDRYNRNQQNYLYR